MAGAMEMSEIIKAEYTEKMRGRYGRLVGKRAERGLQCPLFMRQQALNAFPTSAALAKILAASPTLPA